MYLSWIFINFDPFTFAEKLKSLLMTFHFAVFYEPHLKSDRNLSVFCPFCRGEMLITWAQKHRFRFAKCEICLHCRRPPILFRITGSFVAVKSCTISPGSARDATWPQRAGRAVAAFHRGSAGNPQRPDHRWKFQRQQHTLTRIAHGLWKRRGPREFYGLS